MVLRQSVLDAFNVIGISPDTPEDVAKSTYKKLALTHHPDRNFGDSSATQRFQQVCQLTP
jgi:DnaJ-class molecular chaperone